MMFKSGILIIIFVSIIVESNNAQVQSFDLTGANEKYWYYRDRLMYFVKPGLKQGESNVAGSRNDRNVYPNDKNLPMAIIPNIFPIISGY